MKAGFIKLVEVVSVFGIFRFKNPTRFKILRRAVSLFLITALLMPIVFFGRIERVSASSFGLSSASIDSPMPVALSMPPEPFVFSSVKIASSDFFSGFVIAAFGIWDSSFSWFTSSSKNKSENENSSTKSQSPASIAALPPTTADLSRARLAPINQTGGTSLYSRNFGWSAGLAGLSGRGIDAGFGISYNSLVWVKSGADIVFNPNNDNITPGFRFGYPVIETVYSDPLTSKNTYLMVAPSGARIEFRQVDGATDTFETADSSYAQLKVTNANTLTVTATDGTQMLYELKNGSFKCSRIKDSNGNYITISHDTNGLLQTVTDTLGRVVTVNYDGQGQPISVTQARASGTFTYASFTYTGVTINAAFSGLNMVGAANGTIIKALQRITFADGSFAQFDYNSYGQVWKASNYAADQHKLSHVAVNLESPAPGQTDAPRFSEIKNWAENFNVSNGAAQEVVIPVLYQENQTFTIPGGAQLTGTLLQVTAPDGTISKTFAGNSGWMEGLPILNEDWANENGNWNRKKWSWTNYTQDNVNLPYILNPRATETKVGDATNVRRTTIDYHTVNGYPGVALYGLVKDVIVYDAGGASQLKRSHTEYNLDSAYLSRRIIGLPSEMTIYDENNNLMSKVTYAYDEGNFSGTGQSISPVQHDSTSYGADFIAGRGNLTGTTRWDIAAPTNSSLAITTSVRYNTAGLPVAQTDPLNRTVSIDYADAFDDNQNRNTFAYPTAITDPAGNSSTVKYRYDIGANVYAASPAPAGNSVGKTTSRIYDALGRLERETIVNTGAYTRYEYPNSGIQSKVYSTIVDINNNGADATDEVLSESWFDGAGRTRMTRTEHPGSAGGWSASITEYDIMGRVKRQSVPTETDVNWNPSGDDASRGWLWTTNEYDWKGRVARQINTDGTDKVFSYEGCGCAGGQVTAISGEQLAEGRRRQKVYEDILGRSYKTETLNWDGSVYSTVRTTFNGRNQATLVRRYEGADSGSVYQDTTMTYDGHGRLKTEHRPEQDAGTATVYNYNADDSVQSVTDARGASTSYAYNSRRLVEQIGYAAPQGSNIAVPTAVSFSYDNAGNRTQMTDALGTVAYQYNQLSQMISETRNFNDAGVGSYTFNYAYNLSGQLISLTDPQDTARSVGYQRDKIGRLQGITGGGFAGVSQYLHGVSYRAFGSSKAMTYGSGKAMSFDYNNRLQPVQYSVSDNIANTQFQYYADGRVKFVGDQLNNTFDRSYKYDHAGRLIEAFTGAKAREETTDNQGLYQQTYGYNAFNNLTNRTGWVWGTEAVPDNASYTNNRRLYFGYDAEGNNTANSQYNYSYDAAGRRYFTQDQNQQVTISPLNITQGFDGDGQRVKQTEQRRMPTGLIRTTTTYYVRSTVLGGEAVYELIHHYGIWQKNKGFVYAGEKIIAQQYGMNGTQIVDYLYTNPVTNSQRGIAEAEYDAIGNLQWF